MGGFCLVHYFNCLFKCTPIAVETLFETSLHKGAILDMWEALKWNYSAADKGKNLTCFYKSHII